MCKQNGVKMTWSVYLEASVLSKKFSKILIRDEQVNRAGRTLH